MESYSRVVSALSSLLNYHWPSNYGSELHLGDSPLELAGYPSYGKCPDVESTQELLGWDGFLWATPKKRTSHMKKRQRNAHKYLKPKCNITVCPTCKSLKLMHTLCGTCLKQTLEETAKMRKEVEEKKVAEKEMQLVQAAEAKPVDEVAGKGHIDGQV